MSWSEMEKELAADHGVPVSQLRKIRLVSELQVMLEACRSASDVKMESIPEERIVPPTGRHLSLGSDSASDTSDTSSTGKSSPDLPDSAEKEKDAVQSLLLVAPRARSDSMELPAPPAANKPKVTLVLPPQVTPVQTSRSIYASAQTAHSSIDPVPANTATKQSTVPISPGRLSTANILGSLGAEPRTTAPENKLPPKMRWKTKSPPLPEDVPDKDARIGIYTPQARKELLRKFHAKRQRRVWKRKVRYDCRKDFANNRVRVKGRFVKKKAGDASSYLLSDREQRPRSDSMVSDISYTDGMRSRSGSICSVTSDIMMHDGGDEASVPAVPATAGSAAPGGDQ